MVKKFMSSIIFAGMVLLVPITVSQVIVCQPAYASEYGTDIIADVQNALNNAGFECGTADGVAGSKTHDAIQQYQEENGLTVSGEIDEELLISLNITGGSDNTNNDGSEEAVSEEDDGTEKGSKGNPYEFGEDIPLGQVFHNDEWADMTISFDNFLEPKDVRKIDLHDGLVRCFYAEATVTVKEISAGDDGTVSFDLDANFYTSDMVRQTAVFKKAEDNVTLLTLNADCDYEMLLECPTDFSYDKNINFVELIYMPSSEAEEEVSIWVRVPEYWNGEKVGDSAKVVTEGVSGDDEGSQDDMIDGMRVSFKEAMDSYEEFFDEYCEFMTKYNSSEGTDLSMLADYASFMAQYADMMTKFEAWDSEEMNATEASYYLEVSSRILSNLAQVSAG